MRTIVLDRCPFQALIEVRGENSRDPALMENLG
jgi:hypothetical protein